MKDVSVLVVTFNSQEDIRACLDAVPSAARGVSYELIVIDNDSHDGTLRLVEEVSPEARILRQRANTGFARANNCGIEAAGGRFVLLLNPDAVAWPGSIASLVAYMDAHPRTGIAGPRLHDPDGSLQYSVRNFPTPSNQFFESLFMHRFMPRLSGRMGEVVYDAALYETSHGVGWVSGAAMLLRREALDRVGLLDERFFMYSEEKDLCYRAHLAGWSVDYVAEADVTHGHDAAESSEAFARRLSSRLMYFDKHYRGLRRFGCKVGLGVGLGTRVAAGALAAIVGSEKRHELLVPLRGLPAYVRSRRGEELRGESRE
jgi:N-acetylglucosaminyl-diphospho-decaprenol L-rhamnosyltransferase